jgi:hypothetical protein
MIPSAVGIIRGESHGDKNEHEGSQHQLSNEDKDELDQAKGSVTATLSALSVSGDSTTITVEVKNTGNSSIVIRAIGVHGNFAAKGFVCHAGNDDSESKTHTTTTSTTTTTTTSTRHTETECEMKHAGVIVFVPVDTSVTGTSCVSSKMQLANGDSLEHEGHGLTLTKGQCVDLTFTGPISFGDSKLVLVPSTASGQVFGIHIVASEGANLSLSCKLPVTSTSCSVVHQQKDQ